MMTMSPLLAVGLKVLGLSAQQRKAPIKITVQRNILFAIFLVALSGTFPITSVFGQFPTTGPIIPTTPSAPVPAAPTTTFQSTDDDSFRAQVPEGGVIHDLNNTGSALLEESTRGYGILAQLCPHEKQQQETALPNVSGSSATSSSNSISTSNICVGAQEVVHFVRYPDLETRIQAANTVTPNNDMTTDTILSYHLQKLQEVGYRNIQIVASADMTVNITNPQTNQTIAMAPAKLLEMTYSTNSAPDEIRTGYLISTATDMTPPNAGTTKGYSVFYEGNSTTTTEITTAFGSLPPLLPPSVGQVFDSFELIAAAEVAQPIAPEAPVGQTEGEGEEEDAACDSSYPDFCIPPPPPDLNCDDVDDTNFEVVGSDPHGFDGDNDGIGCEDGNGDEEDDGGDDDGADDDDGGDDDGADDDDGGDDDGADDDDGGDDFEGCVVPPGLDPGDVGC